tara:strand:+ start:1520 stop:1729 length:210 start_codon:yes stop_codon:yes gene_type:complete
MQEEHKPIRAVVQIDYKYFKIIERNSEILEILQAEAIDDRLLEIIINSATEEYESEQPKVDGDEYSIYS